LSYGPIISTKPIVYPFHSFFVKYYQMQKAIIFS